MVHGPMDGGIWWTSQPPAVSAKIESWVVRDDPFSEGVPGESRAPQTPGTTLVFLAQLSRNRHWYERDIIYLSIDFQSSLAIPASFLEYIYIYIYMYIYVCIGKEII